MTRRRATILLHWSVATLLLLHLAAGGTNVMLAWAFALTGLAMLPLALVFGMVSGPGARLEGSLRAA